MAANAIRSDPIRAVLQLRQSQSQSQFALQLELDCSFGAFQRCYQQLMTISSWALVSGLLRTVTLSYAAAAVAPPAADWARHHAGHSRQQ